MRGNFTGTTDRRVLPLKVDLHLPFANDVKGIERSIAHKFRRVDEYRYFYDGKSIKKVEYECCFGLQG